MSDFLINAISDDDRDLSRLECMGFRLGDRGTHTTRTIMLKELDALLAEGPPDATRNDYTEQVVELNLLGKRTDATRRGVNQRLGELYGLDPSIPIFRLMRYFWDVDESGRPLLAILTAISRDPLLRATVNAVLETDEGEEMLKTRTLSALRDFAGDRLNENTLDKVARNVASSWTQSGHLKGRMRKVRQFVEPTPYLVTFALLLNYFTGCRGQTLFEKSFVKILDKPQKDLIDLAMEAKRFGIIDIKSSGGLLHVSLDTLLLTKERELLHGED